MNRRLLNRDDVDEINEHLAGRAARDSSTSTATAFLAVICFFGIGGLGMYFNSPKTMLIGLGTAAFFAMWSRMAGTHLNNPHDL